MAFIDEIKIYAEAGRGGDGVVRWRREKFIPKGGPAGGDGGRGGDFYVQAVRDLNILSRYKQKKIFTAGQGEAGKNSSLKGKNGEDFILEIPIGSRIKNKETGEEYQLLEAGDKIMILRGGGGGYGNEHFKSSKNTTPKEWTPGKEGEKANFHIEVELFADLGFVGLPNAGKSSLLNALTNAEAKIGEYAFTTLDPNLGDLFGFILADIPGIIEGASEGKGLGYKFLRHIKRTKAIAHLVSFEHLATGSTGAMMKAYQSIRAELAQYDKSLDITEGGLADKDEIIILTKTDVVEDKKLIAKQVKEFEKLGKRVFALSLYEDEEVKEFRDELVKILKEKI